MKLKEEIRLEINTNWKIRTKIALDLDKHEKTLQKWSTKDSVDADKLLSTASQLIIQKHFPEHETILEGE